MRISLRTIFPMGDIISATPAIMPIVAPKSSLLILSPPSLGDLHTEQLTEVVRGRCNKNLLQNEILPLCSLPEQAECFLCGCVSCFSNPLDSRKARAASSACGPGAGAVQHRLSLCLRQLPTGESLRHDAPVPHQGLRVPLFNICFRFCLRQSPHWGHTPSKCPCKGQSALNPFFLPRLGLFYPGLLYSTKNRPIMYIEKLCGGKHMARRQEYIFYEAPRLSLIHI